MNLLKYFGKYLLSWANFNDQVCSGSSQYLQQQHRSQRIEIITCEGAVAFVLNRCEEKSQKSAALSEHIVLCSAAVKPDFSVLCKPPRTGLRTDPHLSPGQFQGSWLLFRPQKWPDLSPLQTLGKPDPKRGFNLDPNAPFLSMLIKATLCSVWTIDIKAHELAERRTCRLYECHVVAVNKT